MREALRKALRWLLLPLAVLLVLVAGAIAWLVTTEAGLATAISAAESLDSVRIRVDGASGRLIGPLGIERIEIEHPRATIRIAGFAADYDPLEILAGRISADGLRVTEAELRLRPATAPPKAPSFMPGWLTVSLDDATVARLLVVAPAGAELRLQDIRGSARLSKSEIEFEDVGANAPAWAIAGASGNLIARTPIAMNVSTAWSIAADRRYGGIARAVGDLDRLLVDARIAAPGIARFALDLRDLAKGLKWTGKAEIETLDLAQWIENPPVGPLRASLALSGDVSRYAASGVVHGPGLPETGLRLQGRAGYAKGVVTMPELALDGDALSVRANGTLTVSDTPAYDMRATWSALRWPLAGRAVVVSPRGMLEARGWREFSYRVDGDFEPVGAPPVAGHASGRFTETQFVVEESDWKLLGGQVRAEATLTRDSSQAWKIEGSARDIDPSGIHQQLPGRLSFSFRGAGAGFDANADWSASVDKLSGRFRGQPVGGRGGVRHAKESTEFEDVNLTLGPARLAIDGSLGRDAKLNARLVADDLSAFLPELGGRVDGSLVLREQALEIAFTGHDLAWQSHRAVVLSVDANIDRDGRKHSWLRLRSNGLTVAGFPVTDTRLSLDGLSGDHTLAIRVGAGKDAVLLQGRGSWMDDRYGLKLERIVASGPRVASWRLESATRLSAGKDEANLEPACLVYETRRVCVEGRWQRQAGWSAKATTDAFPLEALAVEAPGKPRYRGVLGVDARASGAAGKPWIADLRAEIRDAALLYKSASGADRSVELGLTRMTLLSDAERHRLNLRVSDAADIDLTVALDAARVAGKSFGELPVSGTVKGSTRLMGLLPLLVGTIDNAGGELALDFRVAGQVGAPSLEGEARLANGSLDFYQANLRLRDIRSTIHLRDNSLRLAAQAAAGEGTLDIDGQLGWRDRRVSGELSLTGKDLLVADVPEARVIASPNLRFVLEDGRMNVTGEVDIPEARIEPADTAGAVLASADERIVRPEATAGADDPFEVATDVRITLGKKVKINAYGLRGLVAGSVRVRTAPREASVASGEFEVIDGVYAAYGRELEVERGRLLFTGGPITDPGVDLRAIRELPGYEVGVIARGPLRRPQLTLVSEPGLPQHQIASMLLVGRSDIQEDPGSADDSVGMTEQGGAMLAGQLGEYVGLDEVGLTQDADTGAELVIGKYLSPRFYISYGISLVEEINTLKLRYTIGDRWTISAESGDENAADIEYRIED